VISTMFSKTKNFSRSQPVTYTVNVVISRERRQIVSLLQTINGKWYTTYRIEAIPITLSYLQGHSYYMSFEVIFRIQLCSSWLDLNCHSTTRGPSAKNWVSYFIFVIHLCIFMILNFFIISTFCIYGVGR